MSTTTRLGLAAALPATLLVGALLTAPTAAADEDVLHNVIYRARVDGVARGAMITYAAKDNQTQTADPTMLPGRTFEANTVLPASHEANIKVSVEWPYSANLHCEILVDNAVVAQADDFISPRLTPVRDDPNYGALTCQAPVGGVPNIAAPAEGPPVAPAGIAPPA